MRRIYEAAQQFITRRLSCFVGGQIVVATFLIFLASPVRQLSDSHYSMLLSQSLLETGTFVLNDSFPLPLAPSQYPGLTSNVIPYQLEVVDHRIYYFFPPGSSILSVPFVAVMNAMGISTMNADRTYNQNGERLIQTLLAAFLMAALAGLFFFTSRLLLPIRFSVLIALAGALGTQVWSTASRGLWSDTWGISLLGSVVFMLVVQEKRGHFSPALMGSVVTWMYFVRPTYSVPILTITIYSLLFHREVFIRYAATGTAWFAGFVAYSWYNYGQVLPTYYPASRLTFYRFWTALAGNLISPSRGLLVFVPVLGFVAFLLVRYFKHLPFPRLVGLALITTAVYLVTISGFQPWWGGHCYGPRYTTGLVPWFVLLGILGTRAMLDWRERSASFSPSFGWRLQCTVGAFLVLLSALINARGAVSQATWNWNMVPMDIDWRWGRVWDWRHPQFLGGLVPVPPPREFVHYQPGTRIDLGTVQAAKYLWRGWSVPEVMFRWTDGYLAEVTFALDEISATVLQMKLEPFLVSGKLEEQRMDIDLNGQRLATLSLRATGAGLYSVVLPSNILERRNILRFGLPDAKAPLMLRQSNDLRVLGIAVHWLQLQ